MKNLNKQFAYLKNYSKFQICKKGFPNQTAPSCSLSLATTVASSRLFALYQGNGPAYMSIREKNIDHMSSRRLQPNPFSTFTEA
ncbi:hypothetical protein T11_16772 [Trichinella zimbabwensis]|uniref:Uncharacterized protein n=1 Tax=Trichinella zimbabwensis TaxID=268475 RepID=A0A0V1I6D6_9BILA|nr:hypothetical protein T11_16772 [Trichinella zimbabwensis]